MIKIYFDMDGVLADFDKKIEEVKGRNKKTGKPNWFKLKAIGPSFWADMEVIPYGLSLYNKINGFVKDAKKIGVDIEIGIMSAIYLQEGKDGKREFLKKHFPEIKEDMIKIINKGSMKFKEADSQSILIDDNEDNVKQWNEAGGKAFLFKQNGDEVHITFLEIMAECMAIYSKGNKTKFNVCGTKTIKWSIEVEAENYEEAQEMALEKIEQTIDARSDHIDDMTTNISYTQELDENGKVVKNYP